VMGVAASSVLLGEAIEPSLIVAMAMILAGIALGTMPRRGDVTRQPIRPVVGPART
jgi:drug/metabolite transporter (DMT)-like permease